MVIFWHCHKTYQPVIIQPLLIIHIYIYFLFICLFYENPVIIINYWRFFAYNIVPSNYFTYSRLNTKFTKFSLILQFTVLYLSEIRFKVHGLFNHISPERPLFWRCLCGFECLTGLASCKSMARRVIPSFRVLETGQNVKIGYLKGYIDQVRLMHAHTNINLSYQSLRRY